MRSFYLPMDFLKDCSLNTLLPISLFNLTTSYLSKIKMPQKVHFVVSNFKVLGGIFVSETRILKGFEDRTGARGAYRPTARLTQNIQPGHKTLFLSIKRRFQPQNVIWRGEKTTPKNHRRTCGRNC
ncbi:hypothetical protein MYX82_05070 [Acidobacteria bacterium AH-259-D05]|nr:hypothetical protein [Acidobacteria bacterium AH-259-D05]